jgi:FlaA1/EpsC-like NDP-sugar epimerase
LINKIISISRFKKQAIMILIDSLILILVLILSFSVRLGYWYWPKTDLLYVIIGAPLFAIPIFIWFDLYKEIIRYLGLSMLWIIAQAISLYALVWGVLAFISAVEGIPRSVIFINWIFAFVFLSGSRATLRWILSKIVSNNNSINTKVVVYGAGSAGRQLSNALKQSNNFSPIAFIDDEKELQGHTIDGVKIIAPTSLKAFIYKNQIKEVFLAIPSISKFRRKEILSFLQDLPVLVRSLPSLSDLAKGKVTVSDLQDVNIKDLLGRDLVEANKELLNMNIENKIVMVTGAGGSIGSELCRQIVTIKPKLLIMYDLSEYALYNIEKELQSKQESVEILSILGSVNNRNRLTQILTKFNVHTIYHAAAYKHVPMVEFNNSEGVYNNIFGTLNCAYAAIDSGVETFVLISTDKAVRPTNTMGATKRFAEMILQALSAKNSSIKFTMVRFGNVLGSSGSVIPLFKKQIKDGGPITVTDSEIVRYFMTIPEAVELVIQSGAMGKGGDVFVLDMGKPVRILDLAKKMIHLSGLEIRDKYNPDGDIEIKFTGLRPGEKLYEELLINGNTSKTQNPMILRAQDDSINWDDLNNILDELKDATNFGKPDQIRELLIKAIPDFSPQCDVVDYLK